MQSSRIGQYTIWYENAEEWRIVRKEVFTDHVYYIELESEEPRIIDLGAYIGDTTMYFKKLYPKAKIMTVEPLPENLVLLHKNIAENQMEEVEIVEAMVGDREGEQEIFKDKNDNGWYSLAGIRRGGWGSQQESEGVRVTIITLDSLIRGKVDLIKIDIEGSEEKVIKASKKLHLVDNMIIEYHPLEGRREKELVNYLRDKGFEVEVRDDPEGWGQGLKIIRASRV